MTSGDKMKKTLTFFSFLILSLFLCAQDFLKEDNNSSVMPSQGFLISTVSTMTPLDIALDPDEYVIGAGDIFIIQIISGLTETFQLQVGLSDALTIPGYGQVDLKGQTLTRSIELIENICQKSNKDILVNVNLSEVKKLKVPVFGAVETPGMVTLPASSRLNEYLKKTKLHHLAKDHELEIRSANDTSIINIYDYYLHGDLKSNPYLKSGESVYIPFADVENECVEVYGPVNTQSLAPIIRGETLLEFYHRKIRLSDISDYSAITITKQHDKNYSLTISASDIGDYVLEAGDILEFAVLERIHMNGYVNRPGTYDFIPGHTVYDYIAMAGGVSPQGNDQKVIIIRDNKKIRDFSQTTIRRGDVILVKRSAEDIMIGQISLLQFIASIASITTAFIAAINAIG